MRINAKASRKQAGYLLKIQSHANKVKDLYTGTVPGFK